MEIVAPWVTSVHLVVVAASYQETFHDRPPLQLGISVVVAAAAVEQPYRRPVMGTVAVAGDNAAVAGVDQAVVQAASIPSEPDPVVSRGREVAAEAQHFVPHLGQHRHLAAVAAVVVAAADKMLAAAEASYPLPEVDIVAVAGGFADLVGAGSLASSLLPRC